MMMMMAMYGLGLGLRVRIDIADVADALNSITDGPVYHAVLILGSMRHVRW